MRTCISCIYLERVYGYARKESTDWCTLSKLYVDFNPCEQYEKAIRYQDRGIIPCLICESDYPQYEADVYELERFNMIPTGTDCYFYAKICVNCYKRFMQEISRERNISNAYDDWDHWDRGYVRQAGETWKLKPLYCRRKRRYRAYLSCFDDAMSEYVNIEFSPIYYCEICSSIYRAPMRRLQKERGICFKGRGHQVDECYDCLCTPCYMKLRPLVKIHNAARSNETLINKLKREVANVRKNQHNRGIERLSGQDDVGGQGQRIKP